MSFGRYILKRLGNKQQCLIIDRWLATGNFNFSWVYIMQISHWKIMAEKNNNSTIFWNNVYSQSKTFTLMWLFLKISTFRLTPVYAAIIMVYITYYTYKKGLSTTLTVTTGVHVIIFGWQNSFLSTLSFPR